MPIRAEIEGVGVLEFEDGTPDDVIDRTVKRETLGFEREAAQREIDIADRFIRATDTVSGAISPFSLGGLGRGAEAVATDLITPLSEFDPRQTATETAMRGGELAPPRNVVEGGIRGAARSAPTVAAAMALGPAVGPIAGMAVPMGAQAFEASGGSFAEAGKGAAMGAAIPVLGAAGRMATGAAVGAGVNRGIQSLAPVGVQRTAEALGAQVPIQGMFMADLIASPEYQAATPEKRADMRAESYIANLLFAGPDVVAATRGTPMARRFESPAVQAGRMLEESTRIELPPEAFRPQELPIDRVTQRMRGVQPIGAVLPSPRVEQALRDAMSALETPGKGDAIRSLRAEMATPEVVGVETRAPVDPGSGEVSFRQPAPDASSIMVEPTMAAVARETARDTEATRAPEPITPAAQEAQGVLTPTPVQRFRTELGSDYQLFPDGTTLRTKAPRAGHPDSGPKERSVKTVYVSPDFAKEVGMWQTSSASGKRIGLTADGKVSLLSNNKEGKLGRDQLVHNNTFSETPEVGMAPLELWDFNPERGVFRGNHPGNKIVSLDSPPATPPGLSASEKAGLQAELDAEMGQGRLVEWLESKRMPAPPEGTRFSGVPPHIVYNAAIDVAVAGVKGGRAVADAIDAAVTEAKRKYGAAVDEVKLRADLTAGITVISPPKPNQPPLPAWLKGNIDALYAPLEKSGIADRIEELVAQRKTAKEIRDELGIDLESVRVVKAKRGLPSMDDKTEFDKWLANRTKAPQKPKTPPQTATPVTSQPEVQLPPDPRLPAFNPGEGQKVRKLAARASVSPDLPREVREQIRKDPRSIYDTQSVADEVAIAEAKTDAELSAGMADPNSNTAVLEGLELTKRALATGDNKAAEDLIMGLAQRGTTLGQLVNQFKLLKGTRPEYIPVMIDKVMKQAGYDPLTDPQRAKITGLSKANIDAENARKAADAEYLGKPSTAAWEKVFEADRLAGKASADLNAELIQKYPRAFDDVLVAVLQGNLMGPISEVANVAGNALRLPMDAASRTGAAMLDAVESAVTGKPRTITLRPISSSVAKLKALPRAAKIASEIAVHGADTSAYEVGAHGGVRLNAFRAMRELRDIFTGRADLPTKNGKVPWSDVAERFIETTFGVHADVMLRGLGTMDAMFRYPERARLINEAALRIGKTPEEAARAVRRPDLILPKDVLKQVEFEAARSVFQQDNTATKIAAYATHLMKKVPGLYLFSRTIVPFIKTPINVLAELLSYTPAGLLNVGNNLRPKNLNRREANLAAAKVAVGAMIGTAAQWMYQKGVISPPLDSSDEAQKARLGSENALPPNHLNLSGLRRATVGEDPSPQAGDELIDLRRMGTGGGILYIMALANRQVEKARTGDTSLASEVTQSLAPATASWALNQTFLTGVSDFIKNVQNNDLDSWMRNWLQGIASVPLPNTLAAVSRAVRDSKPEFRDDRLLQAVGNKLNERANTLGLSVPLGRDTKALPLKIDLWGRPMPETPAGANPWVYHFFDVTRNRSLPDDPVAIELYKLWRRTTDSGVFPSLPDRKLTLAKQQTEPLDYDRYQGLAQSVGQARRMVTERLIDSPAWPNLTDPQKIQVLKRVYDRAREFGVARFVAGEIQAGRPFEPRTPRRGPQ